MKGGMELACAILREMRDLQCSQATEGCNLSILWTSRQCAFLFEVRL